MEKIRKQRILKAPAPFHEGERVLRMLQKSVDKHSPKSYPAVIIWCKQTRAMIRTEMPGYDNKVMVVSTETLTTLPKDYGKEPKSKDNDIVALYRHRIVEIIATDNLSAKAWIRGKTFDCLVSIHELKWLRASEVPEYARDEPAETAIAGPWGVKEAP